MREIKFRAWSFTMKRMFSAEEMTKDQMALLPDGHFANIHGGDTAKSVIYPHDSMLPLQFTGLKDKKGKEIYEGDIVQCNKNTAEVRWDGIRLDPFDYISGIDYSHGVRSRWTNETEIIGNIYENPELLNG